MKTMNNSAAGTKVSSRDPKLLAGHPLASRIGIGALATFALLGAALRLRLYSSNRSLWQDEIKLAQNFMSRDLLELLTVPLASEQSVPPGFLVSTRAAVAILGPYEWVFRLTPFIAGVLLVILAVVLAQRELKSTAARVSFVGLVALSPVLIFYSTEFKQYSSDALLSLCILLAVSYRTLRYGTWILAGVGFVAIVYSLPAIFVAASAALLILWEGIYSSRWKRVVAVGLAWGAGTALHAAYFLKAGVDREEMQQSWGEGFAPFPPDSIGDFLWYPNALSRLTFWVFKQQDPYSGIWVDPWGWLFVFVLLIAAVAVFVSRRATAIVAVGAILMTLVASGFQVYPFYGRVLVFLVPITLFILATGIDELNRYAGTLAAGVATLLMLSLVVPAAIQNAATPQFVSDMRGALKRVESKVQDGDVILVWGTMELYRYYSRRTGFADAPAVRISYRGTPHYTLADGSKTPSLAEYVENKGYRRVWFVTAFKERKSRGFVDRIARSVPILFDWKTRGTRVVLFDFAARDL